MLNKYHGAYLPGEAASLRTHKAQCPHPSPLVMHLLPLGRPRTPPTPTPHVPGTQPRTFGVKLGAKRLQSEPRALGTSQHPAPPPASCSFPAHAALPPRAPSGTAQGGVARRPFGRGTCRNAVFVVMHLTASRQPGVPLPTSPRTRRHAARNLQAVLEFTASAVRSPRLELPGSGAPTPLGESHSIFQPERTAQHRLQPKPDQR